MYELLYPFSIILVFYMAEFYNEKELENLCNRSIIFHYRNVNMKYGMFNFNSDTLISWSFRWNSVKDMQRGFRDTP